MYQSSTEMIVTHSTDSSASSFTQSDINTSGGAFVGGLLDPVILLFRVFGFNLEQSASIIATFNQEYIFIGRSTLFNAFTTMLYPFYYDFGPIGIIGGSYLFGLLARNAYVNLERNRSFSSKGIYLLIIILIYESILRWMGLFSSFWVPFLLFYFLNKLSVKRLGESQ